MRCISLSILVLIYVGFHASAADSVRVLFIGNSYTEVNNLPNIISGMAASDGDVLVYQSSTPGGYTFSQHCTNPNTLSLINQGNWDFVVLQEQSQYPGFPDAQVASNVYPYAKRLDSLIHEANPCAKTVFYMTWGRKNGDQDNCQFFPPLCTYLGMDSLLQLRYTIMAEDNHAYISPVARIWRSLRQQNSNIELYSSDESHPSPAGSFAAAASFYALLFNKNPEDLTYNFSVNANDAAIIKTAAKSIVFDSLSYWRRFNPLPSSDFVFTQNDASIAFQSTLENADSHFWDFGDGQTSTDLNPTHIYADGTFTACLTAVKGCDSISFCQEIMVGTSSVSTLKNDFLKIFPNPTTSGISVSGLSHPYAYGLYSIEGKIIKSGNIKASERISIDDLPKGIYFIRFQSEKGVSNYLKFIKK